MCRACRWMEESRRELGTGFAPPTTPSESNAATASAVMPMAQTKREGDPLMAVDTALFGYNPRQTTILRASWALLLLVLVLLALLGVGDHLFGKYAYAAERSKIAAHNEELAALETVSRSFRSVAAVAKPGVVHIRVLSDDIDEESWSEWQRELREQFPNVPDGRLRDFIEPDNSGSGVLFDDAGYILTNSHVVGGREMVHVRLADDRTFKGRVVGVDRKTDLAVVKINAENLSPLKFGDSDKLEVGDWVLAVGAPFGLTYTVTHGIVSALGRNQIDFGGEGASIAYQDFIQTDASINPGNSGGPLLNLNGEVIGINTAIATRGGTVNAGIAFTIPSNQAIGVARQLVANGRVVRGWLGIGMDELVEGDDRAFGLRDKHGILVNLVMPGTPAAEAGLEIEDIIVAIDNEPLSTIPEIQQHIANLPPGTTIDLDIIRYGQPKRLHLALGQQPDNMRSPRAHGQSIDALGLEVRTLRSVSAESFGLPASTNGVIVQRIDDDATELAVSPMDVIVEVDDEPINNVGDLRRILEKPRHNNRLKFEIIDHQGETRTVYLNQER